MFGPNKKLSGLNGGSGLLGPVLYTKITVEIEIQLKGFR